MGGAHRQEASGLNFLIPNTELLTENACSRTLTAPTGRASMPGRRWSTAGWGCMTRTRRRTGGRWSRRPPCQKQAGSRTGHHPGVTGLSLIRVLKTRQDVTEALESAGFEVVRTTRSSISIADPDGAKHPTEGSHL
ncbi:hypothetical protein [Enterobacter sp. CPE_E331]|uniref:hypothetical protein n=1 Tax=Enterobacter sp. CPE_E331 TaxID=3383889 RepID=UPI003976F729